jgi:hypothetical protein
MILDLQYLLLFPPPQNSCNFFCNLWNGTKAVVSTVSDLTLGIPSMVNDVQTIFSGNASLGDKLWAGADLLMNVTLDASMLIGVGEGLKAGELLVKAGVDLAEHVGEDAIEHAGEDLAEHEGEDALAQAVEGCGGLSFAAATLVAAAHGEQAIGTLHPGEQVNAYNPKTRKMELEPILHVWINHDNDLVDLTLTTCVPAQHDKLVKTSEVIHTNKKHPFLTEEKGFVPVGQIKLGMHVLRANGTYGVVTGWKVVPGTQVMYNLEVAQDHTFTVGMGQWVVHNCPASGTSGNSSYAQNGNRFHYDLQNGGSAQLQAMYPQTDFQFNGRGMPGADVEVVGGTHPSDPNAYPGTNWPQGSDFGDFKPDNASGLKHFREDIRNGKYPANTVPIWYDPLQYIITRIG